MKIIKCLSLLAASVILLASCKSGDSLIPAETTADTDTIKSSAVHSTNFSLSRGEAAYFIYAAANNIAENLDKSEFDITKPWKSQQYKDGKTYYDAFLDTAMKYIDNLLMLCEGAIEAGIVLDENDTVYIDTKIEAIAAYYKSQFKLEFKDCLKGLYNGNLTPEEYYNAVSLEYLANKYLNIKTEALYASVTEEMIAGYTETNIPNPDESLTRNLMSILVTSDSCGGADAARKSAETILAGFKSGSADAESFAKLAKEKSESTETENRNCAKGDMISEIDEWLFAAERKIGDSGIVGGDYGCYILYYPSDGIENYKWDATLAIGRKMYDEWLGQLGEKYPVISDNTVLNSLEN